MGEDLDPPEDVIHHLSQSDLGDVLVGTAS
jgi:hypothetical protein